MTVNSSGGTSRAGCLKSGRSSTQQKISTAPVLLPRLENGVPRWAQQFQSPALVEA
ncbi:hypothetical protein F444_14884 [Phytophthora nicotianae P1976]|uniref:Uncharacterized protein n=2 Tax=Phytophthora nicotianae TaxID=4792 RepID=A0A080ZNQ1_PHYNI|nr:hypothetical protein F444_14884 [Phytophthora nicotianae P1976]